MVCVLMLIIPRDKYVIFYVTVINIRNIYIFFFRAGANLVNFVLRWITQYARVKTCGLR